MINMKDLILDLGLIFMVAGSFLLIIWVCLSYCSADELEMIHQTIIP